MVIQRVKALITLPPDHVRERGAYANPMRDFKEHFVFSRVTGHPNIAENNHWVDSCECWICDQHAKMSVNVQMTEHLQDQEFADIIVLTAMMQNRIEKREKQTKEEKEENLEILLEEKSQASQESIGYKTDSSGSGADVEGGGHRAYDNQRKGKR